MMNKAGPTVSDHAHDVSELIEGDDIHRAAPQAAILSNGTFTSVISSKGATRVTLGGMSVNRWVPGADGSYTVFIRDVESGRYWTATPDDNPGSDQCVLFDAGRIGFERCEEEIKSVMDVFVATDEGSEIRRLILRNQSDRPRRLDVTSYLEIVLNDAVSDAGHPSSKLFVQTSLHEQAGAIYAGRELLGAEDLPFHFAHVMTGDGQSTGFETSRAQFLGRGRSYHSPRGMDPGAQLAGHNGSVLDPVAVLRREVELGPREQAEILLVVGASHDDASLRQTIERITDPTFDVQDEMRAAGAQDVARLLMLDINAEYLRYFRRMAAAIFEPVDSVRAPADMVARVSAPIDRLSEYGLDPHRPIIVVRAAEEADTSLIRNVLKAHRYWASLGISIDIVIFNDRSETEAAEELQLLIEQTAEQAEAPMHVRGGVQTIYADDILQEDQILIQSCAVMIIRERLPDLKGRRREPTPVADKIARPAAYANVLPSAPRPDLLFDNGYGGFTEDGREYAVIIDVDENGRHRLPPQPWTNVIANEHIGFVVSETGAGFTWGDDSREHRISSRSADPILDPHSEAIYIRDEDEGWYWSPTPGPAAAPASYHVYHGAGYTRFETSFGGLRQHVRQTVHRDEPIKLTRVRIANETDRRRTVSVFAFTELVLGGDSFARHHLTSVAWDRRGRCLLARNRSSNEFGDTIVFAAARGPGGECFNTVGRKQFLGDGGPARPRALEVDRNLQNDQERRRDDAAALQMRIEIPPNGEVAVDFLLGTAHDVRDVRSLLKSLDDAAARDAALTDATDFWEDLTGRVQISTPSASTDLMVNRWLPYQNLSCRLRARSSFHESVGAIQFGDQLQDAAAMLYLNPEITRRQILLHAANQFADGDVMQRWHPPTGKGIRTSSPADLLWLPLVTAEYVRATGDRAVLDEDQPFLIARGLREGAASKLVHPDPSDETGSVYEHCCRALDRTLSGDPQGLTAMNAGADGTEGRSKNLRHASFLYHTLGRFIPVCEHRGDESRVDRYREYRAKLHEEMNDVGSRLDAATLAWAVISGSASAEKTQTALDALDSHLVDNDAGIIRLNTSAPDNTNSDRGRLPDNGTSAYASNDQHTVAALRIVQAMAEGGRGQRAVELLEMLNPICRARTTSSADRYRAEPYVMSAGVYGEEPHAGRGGGSWYTGAAGWMYRIVIESIIGFSVEEGAMILIDPRVPSSWGEFSISYKIPGDDAICNIRVDNPDGRTRGIRNGNVDDAGVEIRAGVARIPINSDGSVRHVELRM